MYPNFNSLTSGHGPVQDFFQRVAEISSGGGENIQTWIQVRKGDIADSSDPL